MYNAENVVKRCAPFDLIMVNTLKADLNFNNLVVPVFYFVDDGGGWLEVGWSMLPYFSVSVLKPFHFMQSY